MFIVAIGGGHGINTPGKQSPDGYKENNFNYFTKEYLEIELKRQGFKVIDVSPTRDDTELSDRVKTANDSNADIFISIHFNAMGSKWQNWAEGIETYYHIGSTKGKKLADLVHRYLMKGTKMNDMGVKSDGVLYKNGLYVLRYTKMPAILIEAGFMDNKKDRLLMESDSYRRECAKEICQAVCEYFGKQYVQEAKNINAYAILKEVSNYSDVWFDFVKKHQKDVNLEGLIEKLYYWKGK